MNIRRSKVSINPYGNITIDGMNDSVAEIFELDVLKRGLFNKLTAKKSYTLEDIDNDIDHVQELMTHCSICIHGCNCDRMSNETGKCKIGKSSSIYCNQIEYGEESLITPSYMLYYSGCNMTCPYCHQADNLYSCNRVNTELIIEELLSNYDDIKTISFLGGNPDQSILSILRLIRSMVIGGISIPLVWNSNFTYSTSLREIINRYFDIYIPDFKFGNDICALELGGIDKYVDTVTNNILSLETEYPIIIRVLPIRGHIECCIKPIIQIISAMSEVKDDLYVDFLTLLNGNNESEITRSEHISIASGLTNIWKEDYNGSS